MLRRRQKLVVTSAAVLATVFGAGAMAAPAMASTHPGTVRPASGTGTNISTLGMNGNSCHNAGWKYCLYYQQNLGGAYWGTKQQTFGTIIATYPDDGLAGQGKPVRNDAASMVNNTPDCNVTTWVDPNYTGDFNWLWPTFWGNLTSTLHNNEASISYNTCG
jgi:hypothetical protein